MAWTEAVAGFNEFEIMIQRGDGKQEHVIGTYPAGAFQATFADGFDKQKAIRVGALGSVLGARGDKLHILSTHSGKVDLSETDATNCIAIEIGDIQNVPQDVQLKEFGKISPFASPFGLVTRNALRGISMERKMLANSKISTTTYIDMMGDSRFKLNDDDSARTSFDVNNPLITFTPNSTDVIVIKPDYIFNVDIDTFGS